MRIAIISISMLIFASRLIFAAEPVILTAPAEPPIVETWTLEEVWRIDAEDADAPLLGVPAGGFTAPNGNFLLLDHQLANVLVLSPKGEFVETLSRQGEGPGEINRPDSIFMITDSILGILSGSPTKIVRISLDGTPHSAIKPAEGVHWWQKAKIAQGVIIVAGLEWDFSDPSSSKKSTRNYLCRVSENGDVLHTFQEKTIVTDWSHPEHDEARSYFPGQIWDLSADGTLICANRRDEYRIEFISPEGEIIKVIERPFTPYKRTKEDLKKLAKGVTYSQDGKIVEVKTKFLPYTAAIEFIEVHDDGTIWVTNCYGKRDLPPGIARRYDVFEADGTFRAEVQIQYEYDEESDGFGAQADGGFMHLRNIASASKAMYSGVIQGDDEAGKAAEEEDVELSVIRLQRKE